MIHCTHDSHGKINMLLLFLLVLQPTALYAWSSDSIHYITNDTVHSPKRFGTLKPMPTCRRTGYAPPIHLLQLSGNASQRGYAHGFLLGPQIIDWSVLFLYKTNMKSNLTYYNFMLREWNKAQFVPREFKLEVEAMYQGMTDAAKASKSNLFVPEYKRLFNISDIYLMNAYLEVTPNNSFLTPGPFVGGSRKKGQHEHCSQFVFWGNENRTLSGRNMDGECDDTYITVSHLIVFAISGFNEKRYVSVMWPGHVGGLSLFNEDGLYMMLNCGSTGSGTGQSATTATSNLTGIEYFMRSMISTMDENDANPTNVMKHVHRYNSSTHGISGMYLL